MRTKRIQIFIFIFTIVTALLAFWIYWGNSQNVSPKSSSSVLEVKTSDEGGVQITVEPQNISQESLWIFEITLDTHSVELDQDLLKTSKLVVDEEKTYLPIAWEGSPVGGHHRSGVLSFPVAAALPQTVELQIFDVGGVAKRSFQWEIKGGDDI
jgi:hypothetical protein